MQYLGQNIDTCERPLNICSIFKSTFFDIEYLGRV